MDRLLEISLGVSLLIAILLLTAPLLSKRYSSKWRYWVWLILALRLLLPFNICLPAAPITLSASPERIEFQLPVMDKPQTILNVQNHAKPSAIETPISSSPQETAPQSQKTPYSLPSLPMLLFSLWLLGAASFLIYHLIGYALFWKSVRRYGRTADADTIEQLTEIRQRLNIKRGIKLILHPKLATPMMAGFFHPALLLPSGIHPDDLSVILTHELIHYKRRDLWYKAILLLTQSVHWFNPLVHLMARAACRDIETSCDEQILRGSDLDARRRYGETLLRTIRRGTLRETSLCTNFYGGKHSMKQRFLQLFDLSKKKRGFLLLSLILASTILAGLLVSCSWGVPSDSLAKFAKKLNVTQLGTVVVESKTYLYFSSGKKDAKLDALSLNDFDGCIEKVTKNTFTFVGDDYAEINGVNSTFPKTEQHTSLPLTGKLLTEADVAFSAFTGKVRLSEVKKDDKQLYQYTYSLSDGKNEVMISFYAPDQKASRKELYDKVLSSLSINTTYEKLQRFYEDNPESTVTNNVKSSKATIAHTYSSPGGYVEVSTPFNWRYEYYKNYDFKTVKTPSGEKVVATVTNTPTSGGAYEFDEYALNGKIIARIGYLSADEPPSTYDLEGTVIKEAECTVGKASKEELSKLTKAFKNAVYIDLTGNMTLRERIIDNQKEYQYTYTFPVGNDTLLIQFYTSKKADGENQKVFKKLLSLVRYVQLNEASA